MGKKCKDFASCLQNKEKLVAGSYHVPNPGETVRPAPVPSPQLACSLMAAGCTSSATNVTRPCFFLA